MRKELLFTILLFISYLLILDSCVQKEKVISETPSTYSILLRWNPAYISESRQQIETGLVWGFSFLGAKLPLNTFSKAIQWKSERIVAIDITNLGFTPDAQDALLQLVLACKESEEYKRFGAIDIGRFIMLTINSSNHYYKITGAKSKFNLFRQAYTFNDSTFALIESTVSKTNRRIYSPSDITNQIMAFIAADGTGSLLNQTFAETNHDVFDIMSNGQLRFASYNENGDLMTSSDTANSIAGKPAKCLWCHEINIQPPHAATTDIPGYQTIETYKNIVTQGMQSLSQFRTTLSSITDFSKKQDHTQMELLYITFMEPSAKRLANEWNMPIDSVQQKLNGLPIHQHAEFSFLGDLYDRSEVDKRSPYQCIQVPESAREFSIYEPDLIK